MGLFGLFCLLGPMASTRATFLAGALVGGAGVALSYGTMMAILVDAYPAEQRGKVLGLSVSISFLALTSGPYFGGLLTTHFGWRGIFHACLPLAATGIVLGALTLPGDGRRDRSGVLSRFDAAGTFLYVSAVTLALVGVSSLSRPAGRWLVAGGLLVFAVYALHQRRTAFPVMPLGIFSNRVFALSNLASMIHYGSTYGTAFLLGLYLQDPALGALTAEGAGRLLLVQPLVQAAVSPLAGALSDRVAPRWLASGGLGISAACLLALGSLPWDASRASIGAVLAVLGVGYSLFASPNNNAVMSSVEPARAGLASGILGTFRVLGMSLSMAATTLVLGAGARTGPGAAPFLEGFHLCFRLFAAMAVVGTFASLARGRAASRAATA
jgi:MFS family permease